MFTAVADNRAVAATSGIRDATCGNCGQAVKLRNGPVLAAHYAHVRGTCTQDPEPGFQRRDIRPGPGQTQLFNPEALGGGATPPPP